MSKTTKQHYIRPNVWFDGEVIWAKGENSDPPLLQAQQVRYYLFGETNEERERRVLLAVCAGISKFG